MDDPVKDLVYAIKRLFPLYWPSHSKYHKSFPKPQVVYLVAMPRTGSTLAKRYLGDRPGLAIAPNQTYRHSWKLAAKLKSKSIAELHGMAEELEIANFSGLRKQDLIFRIEQNLLDSDVVLRGEGVLEILPEGYGFLRSQDWNYLYGPDGHESEIKQSNLGCTGLDHRN